MNNQSKEPLNLLKTTIPEGLYGITAHIHSNGKSNYEVVKEMLKAGIKIIQYREKDKKMGVILKECQELRQLTKEYEATFIINDYIDIALLVDADGVHIGQEDLPIKEVRKLLGGKIIGVSTHNKEQAQKAVEEGADYIGVGPIFSTKTKVDVCAPVGFEYLEYVEQNIHIPYVAIGGIKEHNLDEILQRKAKRVCLVTEIVGSKNIQETIKNLNKKLSNLPIT